ncbi:MAG: hypothetical protein ACI9MR_005038 [Myxococcota bacterium]|jgi:hypothetical protein
MRLEHRILAVVALLAALSLPATAASAENLTLGVFVPQAQFSSNAARSAYAERLATRLSDALGPETTVTARAFARRADVLAFLRAKKVDLLLTDGLLAAGRKDTVLAHGLGGPAAALYASSGTSVVDLKGKTIAVAEVGSNDVRFYVNAALSGEVAPKRYFGKIRLSKDSAAALAAVKANVADGAFAPLGHPAAIGLSVVAKAGATPIAVLTLPRAERVSESARTAILGALSTGAGLGGGITGWRSGKGTGLSDAAASMSRRPRVLTTEPELVRSAQKRLAAPPIRLRPTGALPAAKPGQQNVVRPTLDD